jgi:hypothetical protein
MADGPYADTTRGQYFDNKHVMLTAKFLLENHDFPNNDESLKGQYKWFIVEKFVGGNRTVTLLPLPADIEIPRSAAVESVELMIDNYEEGDASIQPLKNFLNRITSYAVGHPVDNIEKELESLQTSLFPDLATLEGSRIFKEIQNFLDSARHWIERRDFEAKLLLRLPIFEWFEDEERQLSSQYNLSEFFDEKSKKRVPRALQNLVDAAGIDLRQLYDAINKGDRGLVQTILENAKGLLNQKLNRSWNQSQINIIFDTNSTTLSILVQSLGGVMESIAERSDGLRQFLSMFCFLEKKGVQKEISYC